MPKELLNELKEILKEEYQVELSDTEVLKYANSFVSVFGLLEEMNLKNIKN